jgi:chromosomal replication initiator protein
MDFKEQFRGIDVLLIDDIQFICGKKSTQDEFFHTFNALIDENKQLIISGDRSPAKLDSMNENIRSRLAGGIVADISNAPFDLRLGILKSKVEQMRNVKIDEKVLEFIATKVTTNIRELEGALNKVVAHSLIIGEKITTAHAAEVLSDLLIATDKVITIMDIQKKVSEYFGIKISDLTSSRRSRNIARPRQVAMFLSKTLTSRSLSEIGRKFGGKDHTTVIHAVKKIEEIVKKDSEFFGDIELIKKSLLNVDC